MKCKDCAVYEECDNDFYKPRGDGCRFGDDSKVKIVMNKIMFKVSHGDDPTDIKVEDLEELVASVKEETLTCKYCGNVYDQLYCTCDAFNDE